MESNALTVAFEDGLKIKILSKYINNTSKLQKHKMLQNK